MSRQLRIPRGVAVVGADLVDAAREIGHAEGHKEGHAEGYRAGLTFAVRAIKDLKATEVSSLIDFYDCNRLLQDELNKAARGE